MSCAIARSRVGVHACPACGTISLRGHARDEATAHEPASRHCGERRRRAFRRSKYLRRPPYAKRSASWSVAILPF